MVCAPRTDAFGGTSSGGRRDVTAPHRRRQAPRKRPPRGGRKPSPWRFETGGRPVRAALAGTAPVAYLCPAIPGESICVTQRSEPIFNVPAIIVATIAALALVHVGRLLFLSWVEDQQFLYAFAFIPARYAPSLLSAPYPGGLGGDVWTFITYAFIHGDAVHLAVNVIWLLPFGSAVARRFGAGRFVLFFAVTAAAGAAMHLAVFYPERTPMIGASAAIAGCMAAASRFVFQMGGPLGVFRAADDAAFRVPAAPLSAVWNDARILAFLAVWFGINILFGVGVDVIPGGEQVVAWQAHIGGFVAGLVVFNAFDPVGRTDRT
jgi:membrane associated rhomboid family serine protease